MEFSTLRIIRIIIFDAVVSTISMVVNALYPHMILISVLLYICLIIYTFFVILFEGFTMAKIKSVEDKANIKHIVVDTKNQYKIIREANGIWAPIEIDGTSKYAIYYSSKLGIYKETIMESETFNINEFDKKSISLDYIMKLGNGREE